LQGATQRCNTNEQRFYEGKTMTKLDVLNKKLKLSGDKKLTSTALGARIMQVFYGIGFVVNPAPVKTISATEVN
jgi:hypothetical protein